MSDYVLIVSGNEMLSGKRQDKHVRFITGQLSKIGFACQRVLFVGDRVDNFASVIRQALSFSDTVIVTGGLGPTVDDLTRPAIAETMGIELEENAEVLHFIQERFRTAGREFKDNNRVQALIPKQGTYFANDRGTAPGLVFDNGKQVVIALPGPPRELNPIVEQQVVPFVLSRISGLAVPLSHSFQLCGIGESNLDHLIQKHYGNVEGLEFSYLAHLGVIEFTIRMAGDHDAIKAPFEKITEAVRRTLHDYVYSESGELLEETIGRLLAERNQTLSVAESCTGGMFGSAITSVAGSSGYFFGGVISYCNEVKERVLGVRPETLQTHGAVSKEAACEMALGVRSKLGSDWGAAITGIAGPDGGSEDKPVGTVWIAVVDPDGNRYPFVSRFFGDRDAVRHRSCVAVMDQMRRIMNGLKPFE